MKWPSSRRSPGAEMAGEDSMKVEVVTGPFDPEGRMRRRSGSLAAGSWGAMSSFVGVMRRRSEGRELISMELEHYPGMTERELEKLARTAMEKWSLVDVLLVHRVGMIAPGEAIVLVACWGGHRSGALAATAYLIDELKQRAPFWKKEHLLDDSSRWVECNN